MKTTKCSGLETENTKLKKSSEDLEETVRNQTGKITALDERIVQLQEELQQFR